MVGARQAISRSGDFKTRAADGNLYIEGYFATFTGEYRMWDKRWLMWQITSSKRRKQKMASWPVNGNRLLS
jgi:hypothetical protein